MSQKKPKKILIVGTGKPSTMAEMAKIASKMGGPIIEVVSTKSGTMTADPKIPSWQQLPVPLGISKQPFLNKPKNKARFNKKKKF